MIIKCSYYLNEVDIYANPTLRCKCPCRSCLPFSNAKSQVKRFTLLSRPVVLVLKKSQTSASIPVKGRKELTPDLICRGNNGLRLGEQLCSISLCLSRVELTLLCLSRIDLDTRRRLVSTVHPSPQSQTYHHQHRNQILWLRLSQRAQILESILTKQTRRPALDKSHLSHLKQICPRARLQTITHMVQHSGQHAPVHALAEFDDSSGEAVALLCQGLDRASGDSVALRDCG